MSPENLHEKMMRIRELRAGNPMHSWRRISEIICDEFPEEDQELRGNQIHGKDLCKEAMEYHYGMGFVDLDDETRQEWGM